MPDPKPRLAEARSPSQPGRAVAGKSVLDTMKTQAMIDRFASYAPPGIDFKPLHASATLAVAQSRELQRATPLVLVQAMMGVTRLGLEINSPLGHAYLIPFEMNGAITIQVVIGYRGFVELAYRSGKLVDIGGDVATMGEAAEGRFKFQKGTQPFLHHTFAPDRIEGESEPAYAYAVATLKDGHKFDVMPWAAITRIKAASQGYQYAKSKGEGSKTFLKNPWVAHEWPMAVKTVLRRMSKTMQLTAALALATALDEMGEERDIDFDSVVDLDPAHWRDLTDAAERQHEGKTGEQHAVKTPEDEKKADPKAEPKPEKAKGAAKPQPQPQQEESENPAPPPEEREEAKAAPRAEPERPAGRQPAPAQASEPKPQSAADFWS